MIIRKKRQLNYFSFQFSFYLNTIFKNFQMLNIEFFLVLMDVNTCLTNKKKTIKDILKFFRTV